MHLSPPRPHSRPLRARSYEDTAGVEVDIATSIAFKKVAERCSALRFVVLVDCHTFSVDRGGAMRRVAALISSFVRPFLPLKESFTFVFTKADALGEAATREAALQRLNTVLKETLRGTSDGDVKEVLNWMLSCLHFSYPFVDIYHPALSNPLLVRKAIETFGAPAGPKMTSLTSPRTQVRCGLTAKAESQIKLDLETHLEELRVMLLNGHAASGAELLRTLDFLRQHVDKGYVQDAYAKAASYWGDHGKGVLLTEAYALVDAGLLRDDAELPLEVIGQGRCGFTAEHGREALRRIALLRLFLPHEVPGMPARAAEEALEYLRRGVRELGKRVHAGLILTLVGPHETKAELARAAHLNLQAFVGSVLALEKLRQWVEVHREFCGAADGASEAMRMHMEQLHAIAASETTGQQQLVLALNRLWYADSSCAAGEARLSALVETARAKAAAALDDEAMSDEDRLSETRLACYRASLTQIEELQGLLDCENANLNSKAAYELRETVGIVRRKVLNDAKSQLHQLLREIGEAVGAFDNAWLGLAIGHPKLSESLCRLEELMSRLEVFMSIMSRTSQSLLNATQHAEFETGNLVAQAANIAGNPARRLLSFSVGLCEREMRDIEPLSNTAAHAATLKQLAACVWIDDCLSASGQDAEAFVRKGVAKLHDEYANFGERAVRLALKTFERLLGNSEGDGHRSTVWGSDVTTFTDATKVLSQLSPLLQSDIARDRNQAISFAEGLSASLRTWSRDGDRFNAISDWQDPLKVLAPSASPSAADLEEVLRVYHLLSDSGAATFGPFEYLTSLDAQIRSQLSSASVALKKIFDAESPADAEKQSAALQGLHTLRAKGLQKITELLPDVDQLREGVAQELRAKTDAARAAVNESAGDPDAAGAALSELSVLATAFRDFDFGQQAAQTANDLKQTLDLRGAKLDETLQESLSSGRFRYVHEYIEPLLGTKDPLKREKLSRALAAAKDLLQQKFEDASASVQDAFRMAKAIRLFDDATIHLNKVLTEEGMDVLSLAATLRDRAVACLRRHVEELEAAIEAQRFAQVVEGAESTKEYLDAVAQLLGAAETAEQVAQRRRKRGGSSSAAGRQAPEPPKADPNEFLKTRAQAAVENAERCLVAVDKAAKEFIGHMKSSNLGKNPYRTAMLCERLGKLKMAATRGGGSPNTSERLKTRYEAITRELTRELDSTLEEVQKQAETERLVTYGLTIFGYVASEFRAGLADHVALQVDVDGAISAFKAMESEAAQNILALSIELIETKIRPELDTLKQHSSSYLMFWRAKQYDTAKARFSEQLRQLIDTTKVMALQSRQYLEAGHQVATIQHAVRVSPPVPPSRLPPPPSVSVHLEQGVQSRWTQAKNAIVSEFASLCEAAKGALSQGNGQSFEIALRQMHAFEEGLTCVDASKIMSLARDVHHAIGTWIEVQVATLLKELEDASGLVSAAESVQRLRGVGRVLLSTWALYVELAQCSQRHDKEDDAIARIAKLVRKHFGGADLSEIGMWYSLLELDVSATKPDVAKAYKMVSKKYHPDKRPALPDVEGRKAEPGHRMQQRVQDAKAKLEDDGARERFAAGVKAPFAAEIKKVPVAVLNHLTKLLEEDAYESVRQVLVSLPDLSRLLAHVDGLSKDEIHKPSKTASTKVKEHMRRIRADVDRLWEHRKYKELNSRLNAVDAADKALAAHEGFYDPSWGRKIRKAVEQEIESIAEQARKYVEGKSEEQAELKLKDFAHKLIVLGRILDELPRYKDFCRTKMAGLLDSIHEQGSWSYCYLFKLGMLLGQGKVGELDSSGKVVAEDDRIGKTIVAEFKHFKDVTTMVWNEEVTQREVGSVVKDALAWRVENGIKRNVHLDESKLIEGFERYQKEYDRCFKEWTAGRLPPEELAQKTIAAAAGIQPGSSLRWCNKVVEAVPTLLARVFCYFTISKSGDSYSRLLEQADKFDEKEGGSAMNMDNVLLKPHCTQVLTVLQMLGYGSSVGAALQRQLMQIRTGEGKSIILGACSTVLALLGFRVRCVCYSDYLSGRDFDLFCELFESFGVRGLVDYSTISEYSEVVTKRKGDIRQLTAALLLGRELPQTSSSTSSSSSSSSTRLAGSSASAIMAGAASSSSHPRATSSLAAASSLAAFSSAGDQLSKSGRGKKRSSAALADPSDPPQETHARGLAAAPEILLVDEVDIFFGEDFYGQTHNQVVQLDVPEAVSMLQTVWRLRVSHRGYGSLLRAAKESAEYRALRVRFSEWDDIIEREVQAMCADVQCFDDPKPHYDKGSDRLGYKIMDGIDYESAVYRYRTAFAHLNAADSGTFRNPGEALKRALKLQVPCGKFSYANIEPDCILGVSGTLDALGDYELKVMERYGIQLYASMPSVYGETQLKFDHAGGAINIEGSEDAFHRKITDETNHKIREGRAVIVFFEAGRLDAYRSSAYFKKVPHANVLDESLDPKTRDYVIRKAATHGQATFASEAFGRGTDFFCKDSKLTNAGGVHVLQTFFALKKADEVQIQGRTARQGKQGTYGLVLLHKDLSDNFKLGSMDGVAQRDIYRTLESARNSFHATACKETEKALAEATRIDRITHQYFDAVLQAHTSSQRSLAAGHLHKLYEDLRGKESMSSSSYHVIFLIDKSSSMGARDAIPSATFSNLGYGNRLGCAFEACDSFVRMRDNAGASDLISLVLFDDGVEPELMSQRLRADMITDLLKYKRWGMGGTSFDGALEKAVSITRRDSSGIPALVMFLTDGCDGGNAARASQAISDLYGNPNVSMKAIGFGTGCNVLHLRALMAGMHERGEYLAAIDGVQLVESFEAAAAELSHTGRRR